MADAGAVAAPAAQAPAATQPAETKAEAVARYKADVGDGEQEYERGHLEKLAIKGKEAARLVSKAEQRSQEVAKKEKEMEARLARFKSKDVKEWRAALKEMGVDELTLANAVGTDLMAEADLTPEQKEIRSLRSREQERAKQDEDAKGKEADAKRTAEVERHKGDLAELFEESMEAAGLPKSSVSVAYPRLARAYMAADAAGVKLTPAIAADVLRSGIEDEHKAMYSKQDEKTGQSVLDVKELGSALTRMFGPDAMNALNRYAVQQYRASKGASVVSAAPPLATTPSEEQAQEAPAHKRDFWKELKKQGR
jgi:hypothetical protein